MAILQNGTVFTTGSQVTAFSLNNAVNGSSFTDGAINPATMQFFQTSPTKEQIGVRDGGISTAKIASGVNINFNSGSAAAPSITRNGDTNTGIFFPSDDQFAITAGGYTAAVFAFNEQGGEIQLTDSSGNGNLLIDNSNGTGRLMKDGTGGLQLGTFGAGAVSLLQGNVVRLTIANAGNVGIGTTSPANKLDVNGNISVPEGLLKPIVRTASQNSGSSIDFTSIPNWVTRITVVFVAVNTNNTGNFLIQIGDSDGIETANYAAGVSDHGGFLSNTSGFLVTRSGVTTGGSISGVVTIVNGFGNYWTCAGNIVANTVVNSSAGAKNLSSTLDRLRISPLSGTFLSGGINIMYE